MVRVVNVCRLLLLFFIVVGVLTRLEAYELPTCPCQQGNADLSDNNKDSSGQNKCKCSTNQEYLTCGSACRSTCDDLSYPLPKPLKSCIQICVVGCFCKDGYYLNAKGNCVKPAQCCTGDNEEYTTCGTACSETCDNKPEMCTKQCVSGCFCKSGYVRKDNNSNSPCIKRSECLVK